MILSPYQRPPDQRKVNQAFQRLMMRILKVVRRQAGQKPGGHQEGADEQKDRQSGGSSDPDGMFFIKLL